MVLRRIADFWKKYENLNLKIAFVLISLQIIHLYWLTTDVVLQRITGESFFIFVKEFLPIFVVVDYIEIPALVAGITFYSLLLYNKSFRRGYNFAFLLFLVLQVYHIFWLTDEIVYEILLESDIADIPPIAAWIAIAIDYLEIFVMVDLFRRLYRSKFR